MFITFEGIEGSGKSTQIKMLKEALLGKGHEVIVLREPGGTILGEKVREAFLEKTIEKISVETETFLLYASRKHLDQNLLKPSLAEKNSSFAIDIMMQLKLINVMEKASPMIFLNHSIKFVIYQYLKLPSILILRLKSRRREYQTEKGIEWKQKR